jgi:signal transduction histidine kinase
VALESPPDTPHRPRLTPLTRPGYWVAYLSPLAGLGFLALVDRAVLARLWPLPTADLATFVLALVVTLIYSHAFLTRIRAQYEETDRLLDTTARQRDRLRLLQETLTTMAANRDWEVILERVVELSRELTGARYGALSVWNPDGTLGRFITSGLTPDEVTAIGAPPVGEGLLGEMRRNPVPMRVDDISRHPAHVPFPRNHPPMTTFMGVPVRFRDQVLGHLYLTDKPSGPFTSNDQELVGLLAGQAGVLITNARLNQELERLAVVEERQRIGMDLHDGTIQSLYGVMLTIDTLLAEDPPDAHKLHDALDGLGDRVARISDDIRHYIFDLQQEREEWPQAIHGILTELGLLPWAEVSSQDHTYLQLNARQLAYLVSFAREALTNVARHAQATAVTVVWRTERGRFHVVIRDNGVGFEPDAQGAPGHFGLRHLAERAANLGGRLTITSHPGEGTTVELKAPLRRAALRRARRDASTAQRGS